MSAGSMRKSQAELAPGKTLAAPDFVSTTTYTISQTTTASGKEEMTPGAAAAEATPAAAK